MQLACAKVGANSNLIVAAVIRDVMTCQRSIKHMAWPGTGDFFIWNQFNFDFNFHKGGVKGQYLPTALALNIDFNLLKMVL